MLFRSDSAHPDSKFIFGTVIDDALGDEVRVTVIAAGFDCGEPKRLSVPVIEAHTLNGKADHFPPNDPLAVALDISGEPTRRITFEELVAEDDIDVPDFMK